MKLWSFLTALGCAGLVATAAQPQPITSVAKPSATAGGASSVPLMSADGQRIFFLSAAPNIASNQSAGGLNLFTRDLVSGVTRQVNRGTNAFGFEATVYSAGISTNGQLAVYVSDAAEVSTANSATNATAQIFARDLGSNAAQVVTVSTNGALSSGRNPMISANGRYVVFESTARDLVPDFLPSSGYWNVFRRDLLLGTTFLISHTTWSQNDPGNDDSFGGSISWDGGRVAFISKAIDLTYSSQGNHFGDVYVLHPTNGVMIWCGSLSNYFISPSNPNGGYACQTALISGDGRFVAITASASTTGETLLFRRDIDGYVTTLISSNLPTGAKPQISTNGAFITFEDGQNVLRWNAATGTNKVVSVTTNGLPLATTFAREAAASADGNMIAFLGNSPDLTGDGSTNLQVYVRDMAAGVTRLVSVATNGVAGRGAVSFTTIAISSDGSRVAFDSEADDLVAADNNGANDVFVRDLSTQQTLLASAALPSTPQLTAKGNAYVGANAMSGDDRFISFTSQDTDLVSGDTNGRPDVFIKDLMTGTTISVGITNGVSSELPVMSLDGSTIAFVRASGTSYSITNRSIFRFDRLTGAYQLVWQSNVIGSPISSPAINADGSLVAHCESGKLTIFHADGGTNEVITNAQPGIRIRGELQDAAFTPDSRFVLFNSTAALTATPPSGDELYAWDRFTRTIHLVSLDLGTAVGVKGSISVSTNSRFVAWCAWGVSSQQFTALYRYDLLTGAKWMWSDLNGGRNPAISGDGRFIVFEKYNRELAMVDCNSGDTTLLSTSAAYFPSISPDARFIGYNAAKQGSSSIGAAGLRQLFIRDRLSGDTVQAFNANANVSAITPSSDGRILAFRTVASDVTPGDYNDRRDVFIVQLGIDSDGDGLDDDWEVTYFGNLSRDGSGDFDGDGVNDRDEFLANTNPNANASYFRVIKLTPLGGGSTRVVWNGDPSRTYRLEFKDNLNTSTWTTLTTNAAWEGNSATVVDATGTAALRFYRVVRVP